MNHSLTLAIFDVGGQEMLLILVVILILFGAKKLPEMARNLGKSVETFKRAANNVRNEIVNAELDEPAKPVASLPPPEPAQSYEEHLAEVAGQQPETPPAAAESKAEITLNVSAAPPAGTVSQNEPHVEKPA